ncbi:putative axoneme central apparatus protein [Monocercomonoides exilis]|uniref:putative axoneme central apparatus protein n=1 Tax=Monocercomonoides exilis TaxID=2049356 RepID=UPI00355939E0|nr:putative axoneme central apparatus protein [Monocercomonoides exilis]|eukprot:MONOS_11032.1-p1 / transcript=MONOS_11032.1 / gene=MONOS_11032 / organism=Monocercomonoides_exilis_PA203 / gene_product=axoneme central apparatus protein, putative / transcript_product=axoneme central apparatus protein, putative / location=Mono_scaffold00529:38628-40590(+) / protein_length=509 / sequence_SO=supercontig / SO=protein_coding / is_pseudo=false
MSRQIVTCFEDYQKARISFVQNIATFAERPQNIDALKESGVMLLLKPLITDPVPSVCLSASLALGRLANASEEMAEAVVQNDILPQLVTSLKEQNKFFKKSAAFIIRSVVKHNAALAQAVVESGALESLVSCLQEFDPGCKESALFALGYIARHNGDLAQFVVDAGAVPLTVLCLQEPELTLKRVSASTLADIAKHTPELAQVVADSGGIGYLVPFVSSADTKLKMQATACLAQIAKHSVDLAEQIVGAELFPRVLDCLKDSDASVRKNAATLIREIAKHSLDLAKYISDMGGIPAVVAFTNETLGADRLPGVMCVGYIAAFSEALALKVITSKGIAPLVHCVVTEPADYLKAAAAWALGQIGRHSADHAKAVADEGVLPKLVTVMVHEKATDDLRAKCKAALKAIIGKCVFLPALEPLLLQPAAPKEILKYIVEQYAKVLPSDVEGRKQFVSCGGLQRIQELDAAAEEGSRLKTAISQVNACYPVEVVRYYTPGYKSELFQKIEEFRP